MALEIAEVSFPEALAEYAAISIAFEVTRVFDVSTDERRPDRFTLLERRIPAAYVKDYDTVGGDAPAAWAGRFDLSRWMFFIAREGDSVGAAAVAFDTPEVEMLEGRRDLAVLWDIRVAPEARGRGIGAALFRAAERRAVSRGCRELKVETQNTNVPACRFYQSRGCRLRAVRHGAYPDLPHEIQLLWHKTVR